MKKIIKFEEINNKEVVKNIKSGAIIIYPTDTNYCLGCNAKKSSSVEQIKRISKIESISIIPPTKNWIYKNLKIKNKNYIKKLPGPFGFILELKKKIPNQNKKIEIKMPSHKFSNLIKKANVPFLAINIINKPLSIKQIPNKIIRKADIIIDDGHIKRCHSTTIDLTKDIPKIIIRR